MTTNALKFGLTIIAVVLFLLSPVTFGASHFSSNLNSGTQHLRGFVDLHTHPMSYLGFGGKLIFGAPDVGLTMPAGDIKMGSGCNNKDTVVNSISQALGDDSATHTGWNLINNRCGDLIRNLIITKLEGTSQGGMKLHSHHGPDVTGYPDFSSWPRHNDITHQQMWVDWIHRTYQGGLRVMVALAVNSLTLAKGLSGNNPYDDKSTGYRQIAEMKKFVDRHDWMEIALTSQDIRRIVSQDKLAIVLGVEIDDIGNLIETYRGNPNHVTDTLIRNEIENLYKLGVRYIFPVHLIDNIFGGTAVYEDSFNVANKYHWGRWWEMECASDSRINWQHNPPRSFEDQLAQVTLGIIPLIEVVPTPNCKNGVGNVNIRGLQRQGKVAVLKMMQLGMLIDIDHSSANTTAGILQLAEQNNYPIMSGHNGLIMDKNNKRHLPVHENERTGEQYQEIERLGGMAGLGWSGTTAQDFLNNIDKVLPLMKNKSVALGTDIDGMAPMPAGPCSTANDKHCAVVKYNSRAFPLAKTKTGTKTWDYNYDGVAHYGLIPDFLRHVEILGGQQAVNALFQGAESFAKTWHKAENRKSHIALQVAKQTSGDFCDTNNDCATNRCDRGKFTTKTSRCIPNDGHGRVGEFCTDNNQCLPSLNCKRDNNSIVGICTSKPGLGQDCSNGIACRSGLACSPSPYFKCTGTNVAANGYCNNNNQCASHICTNNRCLSKARLGEYCGNGRVCISNRCDNYNEHKCIPNDGTGRKNDYCTHPNQCKPGLSCRQSPGSNIGICN